MIQRQILLLRANAILEGNGPDDHIEAGSIALQLTRDISDTETSMALASEFAYCLQVIAAAAKEGWETDPRPHARAVLEKIEAHSRADQAGLQNAKTNFPWSFLQRMARIVRHLLRRPEHGHS